MTGPVRVVELPVPAGTGRDALLAAILERVPADATLTWAQTYEGDGLDHVLVWEEDPSAPAAG
ncbi:hypothetical protein [Parafrankia discariae]|uniref:hypothetical protein n=1 Tax=Parafrankia discariae TaxID=365528 RepID=UPI000476C15B|nr:hypothetical protein [Parafrankia discariae]